MKLAAVFQRTAAPLFNRATALFQRTAAPLFNRSTAIVQLAVTEFHVRRANLWRDNYNPLRGLTIERAVSLLEEGERGAYADLQWTYRFIEKRDATLRAGKRNLISSIEELDWDIRILDVTKLPQGTTESQAQAQAEALRAAYERVDNLRAACAFLALAEFRGFSHLEKHYALDGSVTHLEPVPQWHWCRRGINGDWTYNADAASGRIDGTPIDARRFIIREVEDPINEIALICHIRKNLSQKDWDGFVETFGIPSIFAIMPQNVPAGQESVYQELAERVIGNSRGSLPAGSDVKGFDAGARGGAPFREHLRYQDEQIVMAITSSLLTMLTQSGSGTLAGGAHQDTFGRIIRALAKRISEVMHRQFDQEILRAAFPGQPQLAYFELAANEEQDTGDIIKHAAELASAGYQMSATQLAEKTGYEVAVKPPAPLPAFPGGRLANRAAAAPAAPDVDPKFLATARLALGPTVFSDLRPVLDELASVLKTPDNGLAAALQNFRKDLPQKLKSINADPASAAVFQDFLGTAVVSGLASQKKP